MNKIEDGGPAFPVVRMALDPDTVLNHPGMTLRDWFAGQALDGILKRLRLDLTDDDALFYAVKRSYVMADAMLEARRGK